ncbi:hypothetical protein BJF88_12870 [Cellulosimicrobium sp. CUA-896]|nr:hypothetical protein BJF88_12870 [Cellulosimicrobium sp. CUA-896]
MRERCHDRGATSLRSSAPDPREGRMVRSSQVTGWVGWIWFAGIVLVTLGFFNAISGLVAVFSPNSLVGVTEQGVVVLDVSAWGWIHLVIGILLVITGFALLSGRGWARMVAIVLVVLNAVAQFTTLQVTPWWSIITILLDVFVLWALVVHGDEAERAAR